jgi:hypothetical protein
LETKHIAADRRIKRLVESHCRELAFAERHIAERPALGAGTSLGQSSGRSIDADDLPGGTDQIGGEEGDVAGAATDIEDAHPGPDASLE